MRQIVNRNQHGATVKKRRIVVRHMQQITLPRRPWNLELLAKRIDGGTDYIDLIAIRSQSPFVRGRGQCADVNLTQGFQAPNQIQGIGPNARQQTTRVYDNCIHRANTVCFT